MLYGGPGLKEFLGCLNCNNTATDSVWNAQSQFGIGNGFGIWSPLGQYANPYSRYAACNDFATDPPVIMDLDGAHYGRFSVNVSADRSVCGALGVERVCVALKSACNKT